MKAIVQDTYGPPDVLRLADIDRPEAGPEDVLIRVHAAGVDPGVWHMTTGLPYLLRLGAGFRAPKTRVRADIAGTVAAVGAAVTEFRPGDEVFGTVDGGFAEWARGRAASIAHKPAGLSFEQAATIPVSGCTALRGLRNHGRVQSGQQVLVIGAAGGVGSFAVQLAKAFGAEVTGVCSTSKVDLVRSLGADDVVDYTHEDFADRAHRFDLILDTAGNRSVTHLRRALAPRGTLLIVGGEGGGRWFAGMDRALRAHLLSLFVRQRLGTFISTETTGDLVTLTELIEAGKVTPVIDRTYPLREVPEAIRYLHQGHARGKIAITV